MSQKDQVTLLEAIFKAVKSTPNNQDLGEVIRSMVTPDLKIPNQKETHY